MPDIKKIKRWLQRHKWSSAPCRNTPMAAYLESPVHTMAGLCYTETGASAGKTGRQYSFETRLAVELDGPWPGVVRIRVFRRKHYWKRDPSIPDGDHMGYSHVPSDEFSPWTDFNEAPCMSLPLDDFLKLAELFQALRDGQDEPAGSRKKRCYVGLIGVDTDYGDIARRYSNDRLREERGWASSAEREQWLARNGKRP